MKLNSLLKDLVGISKVQQDLIISVEITGMSLDSRQIQTGDLFIALVGSKMHGLNCASQAIGQGAGAILFDPAEGGNELAKAIKAVPAIAVENLSMVLGELAARFYGKPSESLKVIGITGTNGKTSCSQFLGQVLDDCAIIGTLGWGDWSVLQKTVNTTPDALATQRMFADFKALKKRAVAMEVSSHGLAQGRVNGVEFTGAVFTNLSRDHLDYHKSMDEYLDAKLKLFAKPELKFAVINLDDDSSAKVVATVSDLVPVWGISAQGKSVDAGRGESIIAKNVSHTAQGFEFEVSWHTQSHHIAVPLFGEFNVENVLCVLAVMLACGMSLPESAKRLKNIQAVAGRMEPCIDKAGMSRVFIDYAHTPDALERVLASLRQHCHQALWVVFGCGGNRDTGKRPLMGEIAERWADHVVITDDNPRFESNIAIAKEILMGCKTDKAIVIQDRKRAIEHVIMNADSGDCVVIAGKGHEDYQEINDVRNPFSDKLVAEMALTQRRASL